MSCVNMKPLPDLVVQAILEKELYTTPPLMPVAVAKIIGSNKDIPRAFKLTKDSSNVELRHLRRIKNLPDGAIECIICKIKSQDEESQQAVELKKLQEDFAEEGIFCDYRIALVPSSAPKTDLQLKACQDIWPCKFAKNNYFIQCMQGTVFSDSEMLVLRTIVNSVLHYVTTTEYNSASVVFRYAKVYGAGLTSSKILTMNPVQHSTMLAVDSVATTAGSGHWRSKASNEFIEIVQRQLDSHKELEDHKMDDKFLPYLCTNYDVFATEEPCLMCTMGLVQSRVRRLFYLDAQSIKKLGNFERLCFPDGAIEEFLLHREKNLNHRFEAWRVTLTFE